MKKVILLTLLLMYTFSFGKTTTITPTDTIWYDANYKVSTKQNSEIYKITPYKINDKYLHVYFYKSNHKNHLISYSLDVNDTQFDGKRTFYYENGNVKNIITYRNNLKDGVYLEYYENAKIYIKGEYCDDRKIGLFIIKNKNGSIHQKEYWENGIKTDKFTTDTSVTLED